MLRPIMHVVSKILCRNMTKFDAKCESGKVLPEGVDEFADIPYRDTGERDCVLDVYVPAAASGALPYIIDIHGGGLVYGHKELNKRFCYALALRGFVVVSIDYRLVPAADLTEQLRDVTAAFRWAEKHIGEYGGDPARAYLCGDSAGAFLGLFGAAISASTTLKVAFVNEGSGVRPRGFFFVSGMFDLRTKNYIKHLCKYACGKKYKRQPWYKYTDLGELLREFSPPPIFLTSSGADMLSDQTQSFVKYLDRAGAEYELDFKPLDKALAASTGHSYYHIYPVKNPEWEECTDLIRRACEYLTNGSAR